MNDLIIDTAQNIIRTNQTDSQDPFHDLPASEWVEKQIAWRNKSQPSGLDLEKLFVEHFGNKKIVGAEIGVCLAASTELFMKTVPNITKYYAIDNYPSYTDWNGAVFDEDRQSLMKQYAFEILKPHHKKIEFVYENSTDFAQKLKDDSLDFIFIDGDHSYDGFTKDLNNYFSKIKTGGIISGDDIKLPEITRGVNDFFAENKSKIKSNNKMWYIVKE